MKKRRPPRRPQTLGARSASWLKERIDLGPLAALLRKKTVPTHRHSWVYLLGGAAVFLFALQVASGCLLMLYYQPTEASAHESVRTIVTEVPYGWLIRSIHVWGADLFIGVVLLHFLTVLLTRAYRKPRELTWLSGMFMLLAALGFGFSGYLLPWNELSYYATLVGTAIPESVPGIGPFIVHFLRGSEHVTGETITRFYAAHVMILPLGLGLLLMIHLLLVQAQGMSLPLGMKDDEVKDFRPFFSEFILLDASLWLLLFGAIMTLAVFLPAEIGIKADPLGDAPQGIKPEWYFLFMYQTLKMLPETAAMLLFTLVGAFLVALPFLDRAASRGQRSPGFTGLFVLLLAYVAVFQVQAMLSPGASHSSETPAVPTANIPRGLVSLAFLWSVIGFLIFYLRQLLQENARMRTMYQRDP